MSTVGEAGGTNRHWDLGGAAGVPFYSEYFVVREGGDSRAYDDGNNPISAAGVTITAAIAAIIADAGAGGPCDIKVKKGTYGIAAAADIDLGALTHLRFSPGCKLDVTGNLTDGAIVLPAAGAITDWEIKGPVEIDLNGFNGAGIYGDYGGRDYSIMNIEDVKIDAVAATFAGVDIYRCFYTTMRQVWVRTNGTGFRFRRQTDAVHYGNSYFEMLRSTNLGSNDVIGLHIQGSGGIRALNLCQFNRIQIGGSSDDGRTGTVGIRIENDTDISFFEIDIEGLEKGVHISDSERIMFNNPFIYSIRNAAATRGVELDGACGGITFDGGLIESDSVGTTYLDNTDALTTSRFMCLLTGGVEVSFAGWDLGNRTRCDKAILWNTTTGRRGYSENSGVATILNGNNSLVVVHNLAADPVTWGGRVTLTGTHTEVAGAIVTATDATDFTIGTPDGGNVGQNTDVHWEARITG